MVDIARSGLSKWENNNKGHVYGMKVLSYSLFGCDINIRTSKVRLFDIRYFLVDLTWVGEEHNSGDAELNFGQFDILCMSVGLETKKVHPF